MNRVERFLQLAEWGFNVPIFILNPSGNYGRDCYVFLKEFFIGTKKFSLLADREDSKKIKSSTACSLVEAFHISVTLEFDGYRVLVMEYIPYEFTGWVDFYSDGCGKVLTVDGAFERFQHVDFIKDVKLRCIVRSLSELSGKTGEAVRVFFGWSKNFTGVNYSKLIFQDYKFLKNFS